MQEPTQTTSTATALTQSPVDVDALLRQMNHIRRRERDASMRQAQSLPPERVLQVVQEGSRRYRRRKRQSTCVELTVIIGWIPCALLLFIMSDVRSAAMMSSFFCVVGLVIVWHLCFVPVRMCNTLVHLLREADDLKLLGPAISMYVRPDDSSQTHRALGSTLGRLLPQLRADQAGLLDAAQKHDLLLVVATPQLGAEIRIQALKALEQIGDESAYAVVQNVGANTENREVREAAKNCLEYLKQHAGQRREMNTLLRASGATEAAVPDTLLRPASSVADTSPEQLLRPQM